MADKINAAIEERRAALRTMRDDIKVRIHLAEMDVKDRWAKLEPQISRALDRAEGASERALDELMRKLKGLKAS